MAKIKKAHRRAGAGKPQGMNYAQVLARKAATQKGLEQAAREEHTLARALWEGLRAIPEVELPVAGPPQAGIVSFSLPPFHPYDVAVLLDQQGVAVRSGTHCAHPLFDALGMPQGVVRASLGLYNTLEDVERLCKALRRVAAIKL